MKILKVSGGTLRAWASEDENYPGINVEFVPDEPTDAVSYPRVILTNTHGQARGVA